MVYHTREDDLQVMLRRERNSVRSVDAALDMINATLDVVDVK